METRSSGDALETSLRRGYATRAALQRLHQQQSRRVVLRAYREQRAICHLRRVERLDAAPILRDHHAHGTPAVTNDPGLGKMRHAAYDTSSIGIDPDARIHVRGDILREGGGPTLQYGIQSVADSRLISPRKTDLHPSRDVLAERFERFRAG